MNQDELIKDVKDLLIRIEGTINILENGNAILTARKLQGVRDKARIILKKVCIKEDKNVASQVTNLISGEKKNESH